MLSACMITMRCTHLDSVQCTSGSEIDPRRLAIASVSNGCGFSVSHRLTPRRISHSQ